MTGRLVLRLKGGIDPDMAKKAITAFGCKIIDHSDRMFLVEVHGEAEVDDLHLSKLFAVITKEVMMHKCITVDLCGMTDSDVNSMTEEEAKAKLKSIRDVALWWAAQEDDDRCYLDAEGSTNHPPPRSGQFRYAR